MDLQLHYGKMRQEEQKMTDEFPVIVSNETSDGGKANVLTEVTRRIAARFITLGFARLATGEERKVFLDAKHEARQMAIEALERANATATILATQSIERLHAAARPKE
jgi:hypothetical protein